MKFQRINRADPEKIFVVCKNAYSTAAQVQGNAVIWAFNGTDDGLAITQPTTTKAAHFAGIVAGGIAIGGYGEVQCYGLATAKVSGSTDVTNGNKLSTKTGTFNLIKAAGTLVIGESPLVSAGESYTTTATSTLKKVFVRGM